MFPISVRIFCFPRPSRSAVFCEKEAFKRRLRWRRAAGSSRRGGLSPAPAPLCNSLFRGVWFKPVEIKRLFNFTCPRDGPELPFSEHRRPPAKRKTHKIYFNWAAESHDTTVPTRSDKCSPSFLGPLLFPWFIYIFNNTRSSYLNSPLLGTSVPAVDFWASVSAHPATRLLSRLSKETVVMCVITRENHYAKSISP